MTLPRPAHHRSAPAACLAAVLALAALCAQAPPAGASRGAAVAADPHAGRSVGGDATTARAVHVRAKPKAPVLNLYAKRALAAYTAMQQNFYVASAGLY